LCRGLGGIWKNREWGGEKKFVRTKSGKHKERVDAKKISQKRNRKKGTKEAPPTLKDFPQPPVRSYKPWCNIKRKKKDGEKNKACGKSVTEKKILRM